MIRGKVAVVTGGTRGIGYSIVLKFLQNGAKVVLFGSKDETVKKAIKSLKDIDENYDVMGFSPNLSDIEEVSKTFETIKECYGKIDILVNNAGVSSSTKLEDYEINEVDKIIDLNIKSVFICSKAILPYLKETKGSIINTSSMVSINGQSSGVMYPASKFAVNGITKSLALELALYGIRVNAVLPGITETDMVKNLPKDMINPLIKTIPLGRIGTPDDISNAFLFLASDMSSYITGELLSVDGGKK